jgi:hypothetical protein
LYLDHASSPQTSAVTEGSEAFLAPQFARERVFWFEKQNTDTVWIAKKKKKMTPEKVRWQNAGGEKGCWSHVCRVAQTSPSLRL